MLQSSVVFSVSRCGMVHDWQKYLAQVSIFWSMCNTGHSWCCRLIVIAGVANWKGQSLREITNCLKLLGWVHSHNINHIAHAYASLWIYVAGHQPSLQSHCNGAKKVQPGEKKRIRLEAQGWSTCCWRRGRRYAHFVTCSHWWAKSALHSYISHVQGRKSCSEHWSKIYCFY